MAECAQRRPHRERRGPPAAHDPLPLGAPEPVGKDGGRVSGEALALDPVTGEPTGALGVPELALLVTFPPIVWAADELRRARARRRR